MTKHASKINPVCSRKDMVDAANQLHNVVGVVYYRADCATIPCKDCSFSFSAVRVDQRCIGRLLSQISDRLDEIVRTLEEEE